MRRTSVLLPLLLVALAVPASACLNDSETRPAESEFNKGYGAQTTPIGRIFMPLGLAMLCPPIALVGLALYWKRKERLQRVAENERRLLSPTLRPRH